MVRVVDMDYYGCGDEQYNNGYNDEGGNCGYCLLLLQIFYGGNCFFGVFMFNYGMDYSNVLFVGQCFREFYFVWILDVQIFFFKEEVEDIFLDLMVKFGFQCDSMCNMYDYLMIFLDLCVFCMMFNQVLLFFYVDYIGGDNVNYCKWYFVVYFDLDDVVGFVNMKGKKVKKKVKKGKGLGFENEVEVLEDFEGDDLLEVVEYCWKMRMNCMLQYDWVRQFVLFLFCWGEVNQVCFMVECFCFIFKCVDDYFNLFVC